MDPAAKKRRLEDLMGGGPGVAGPSAPPSAPGPSSAPAAPSRDAYVVNANEAVSFRLVSSPAELEAAPCFNPEFTHQVFREDETIFGYLDLEVRPGKARTRWQQHQSAAQPVRRGPAAPPAPGGCTLVCTSSTLSLPAPAPRAPPR